MNICKNLELGQAKNVADLPIIEQLCVLLRELASRYNFLDVLRNAYLLGNILDDKRTEIHNNSIKVYS